MCSLTNAINLYREEKQFVIVKANDKCQLPIKNTLYKSFEKADIDRIYYQPDYEEMLKVIEIKSD